MSVVSKKWRLFLIEGYRQLPDGWTAEDIFDHRLEEAQMDFIHFKYDERFPPDKFPKMLCIGAGTGAEVLAAKEYGYDAVGIGILNHNQIRYARSRGAIMFNMDMHDIVGLPVESFDVIYSRDSLEHAVAPWIAVAEAWAMLRPGGRWWITMGPYKGDAQDSRGPTNDHFSVLPGWVWDSIFKRSGFKILEKMDDELLFRYLLEKLPLDKIDPEYENHQNLAIVDQLRARLQM
jgi:SAM-dependent methyltransferase